MNYDSSNLNYNYQILDNQNTYQTQSINFQNIPQRVQTYPKPEPQQINKGFNYVEAPQKEL